MATIFNKRLFGTDLDPEIKNKLRARQLVGKHSILPNTSNQFVSIQGQDYNISDLIGDVNFGFDNVIKSYLNVFFILIGIFRALNIFSE